MTFSTDLFLEYKKRPEPAALARLLERHQDAVYSICLRVLRHPQDAEDACQDVLLEVSRQVDTIDEPGMFPGWLYRTALHTALDFKRQRGRRKVREAGAPRASGAEPDPPGSTEALYRGLAGLDDTARVLVVEHYFGRRPLRELAAELGCSEVAVWKRIQQARERLRKALGSAAVSALEGIVNVPAPAGLLPQALGLQGGLVMAMSGGIKLAIVAPLLLLAGAATVLTVRPAEPPPPIVEVGRPASPLSGVPETKVPMAFAAPRAAAVVANPSKSPSAAPRRPYPLRLPTSGYTPAAVNTWAILSSKRVMLDISDESTAKVLQMLSELTGLTILSSGDLEKEKISIKVLDIVGDSCLRLMLGPRQLAYEIRPDGTIFVGPQDTIAGGYEKEAHRVQGGLYELTRIREELDGGWDGLRDVRGNAGTDPRLLAKPVVVPQGETTLEKEFERLEKLGVNVALDPVGRYPESLRAREAALRKPFLQVVAERSILDHLDALAQAQGLVAVATQGGVHLTSPEIAAAHRAAQEEARRDYERLVSNLDKPVEGAEASTVADFLDSIPRSVGLAVVPSEEVWNSGETLTLSAGTTLRQALDQLKALGFRWALRAGKLYLLK